MKLLVFCTIAVGFMSIESYFLVRAVLYPKSRIRSLLAALMALGWPCLMGWLLGWIPHTALARDLLLASVATVGSLGTLVVWHHESQR